MTEKTSGWHQNAEFKQHEHTDWRQSVDKLLAGADFDSALVSSTFDDIKIQPLYLQNTDAPFIGRGDKPWSIRQSYKGGTVKDTNLQILSDLSDGVNSVELTLATTDDKPAKDKPIENSSDLHCHSVDDLTQLLADVNAEMIQLSLTPGSENRLTGALLLAYCHRQKTAPKNLHCALNIDPLKSQAETGQCPNDALATLTQYASYCANQFPNTTSLCIDSSVYHNAGCTEAQEIAYCLATTVEYLRALNSLTADTAFSQMRFRIALDSDFFLNVAKLRATRELLRQVKENCGAKPATSAIDAVSGTRALTTLDAATNILRISTQTASAMAGGANGFDCATYNQLSHASEKAQRLARNTHHVLIEESGLLNVDDPTRGSGYVEALTTELCESAWSLFQNIESAGGMRKALTDGLIAEQISDSCQKRTAALAIGETTIVGVTAFADLQETPTAAIESGSTANSKDTNHSSSAESPASVVALVNALSEGGSTLDHQNHCSAELTSTPIGSYRDAEIFEQLRLRSQAYKTSNGSSAEVTLLTIGGQKDYSARTGFCKNFLAIAGIQTNLLDLDSFLQSKTTNKNKLTILCSSDKLYLEHAAKVTELGNIENLWIAGNNPKVLSEFSGIVTESIHLRCHKTDVLNKALTLLGVTS